MKSKIKNKNKVLALVLLTSLIQSAYAAPIALSQGPLFLSSTTIPNIMVLYGNSNSMDEQADGQAVGSNDPDSKSEITRKAVKTLITNYQGRVNMGLMGYAQSNIEAKDLSNSPYDISYNPATYDPSWTGARNSATHKKFRLPNPADPTRYVYYNVALPGYNTVQSVKSNNNLFCFTNDSRSKAFNNNEQIVNNNINDGSSGPWLPFYCYGKKTGTMDAGPTSGAANNAPTNNGATAGYGNQFSGTYPFSPTDSDLAQGITNFGNQIMQMYVGPSWLSQTSPGYGYVHVPVASLNATQATKLNTKLGTAQFTNSGTEKNAAYPLVNAGLTPLAGTVNSAGKYFAGTLSSNEGGPLTAPPNSCGKNYLLMLTDGLPSVLANGTISYNTTSLLNDLTTSVSNLRTNNSVNSYVIGFALPYGVDISQLNNIAAAGGTSTPYYADDSTSLNNALNSVFTDIVAKSSAAASVALNSGYISAGDKIYQARFSSTDWSGDLLSVPLSATGALPSDLLAASNWKAQTVMTAQTPNNRVIITSKASTGVGIPFRWPSNAASPSATELDLAQSTALNLNPTNSTADAKGQLRLNYLRGDRSQEPTFRARGGVLGDIINSSPILVKAPQANYLTSDYLAFKNTYINRTPVIYVGANDGMLHGINANTGAEVLAYVPESMYSNLNQLTASPFTHRYFVDGSPNSSDVKFTNGSWHTMVVSGMGAGAQGIFALDVTNPATFTENNAANIVKFEYRNTDNADIGNISGPPSIVKLNNGKWAAVFGNGWNNAGTGQSALFVVDVETGALIKEIRTGVGNTTTPNGLANPATVDVDGNGTVDYVYAGDIYGNMWKFDLTDALAANWKVGLSGSPLFNAGTTKPITMQPEITTSPNGGYMVLFGTGQYLQNTDIANTTAQSFYGVWDNNIAVTSGQLVSQTITQSGTYRNITTTQVNYPTQKGWVANLPVSGERTVSDPVIAGGKVFFSSLIPSTASCSYGGTSWLMTMDYLNGSQPSSPVFDTNNDGAINATDTKYGGVVLSGISSSPTILKGLGDLNNPLQELFFNLSSGNVTGIYTAGNKQSSRRSSWRPIIQK